VRRDLDPPEQTVQESRNWLVDFGATQSPWHEEARVGYAPPRFLDGAELLSAGLARGAVEARVSHSIGAVSYYHSFDASTAGVRASTFGSRQRVDAFALDAPAGRSWSLRGIGMRVETEPTQFQPGGLGQLFGLLGRWSIAPAASVLFEGAHADFDPEVGPSREGWAFKLGVGGTAGTLLYSATIRYTDADFVNPANPGFTPGAVANRTGGDLSLMKSFGRSSASLQYRHIVGGATPGSSSTSSHEDGGTLSFQRALSPTVSAGASGNFVQDSGDADPALSLPSIDRRQYGGTLTASETSGRISFSQSYAYQRVHDAVTPPASATVQTATISAVGTLFSGFNFSAFVSGTRSEGSAAVGRTDQLLVSIQPMLAVPSLWLAVQPRVSYSQSRSSVFPGRTHTEQYQALVAVCPPWQRSLVSLQLSGDWNRSRTSGQPNPGFQSRLAAALAIRWGAGQGVAAPPATVLPGTASFAPPQGGAASPGKPAGAGPTIPGKPV